MSRIFAAKRSWTTLRMSNRETLGKGHGVVRVDFENMAESCLRFRRKK